MSTAEYIQLRAFARVYGLVLGAVWAVGFVSFARSLSEPGLSLLFDASLVSTPILFYSFARGYRDRVLSGRISLLRAWGLTLMIALYATLIMAAAQWAYMEFADGGQMVGAMRRAVAAPEFQPVLVAYGVTRGDVEAQLTLLSETRPIDFAFSFIWINAAASAVIGWVAALFVKRSK